MRQAPQVKLLEEHGTSLPQRHYGEFLGRRLSVRLPSGIDSEFAESASIRGCTRQRAFSAYDYSSFFGPCKSGAIGEAVRFGPVALRSPFKGEIMNVLVAFEIMLGCTGVGFAALIYMEVRKIRKGKLI
jgi:hypothetical protein